MPRLNLLTVASAALIASCSPLPIGQPKLTEQQRSANPSGKYEAVVAIRETGATVATPTEIYILKAGSKPKGDPALRADHVTGLDVRWTSARSVVLHADAARIFLSTNHVSVDGDDITIELDIDKVEK